jgi:hypothetical protein
MPSSCCLTFELRCTVGAKDEDKIVDTLFNLFHNYVGTSVLLVCFYLFIYIFVIYLLIYNPSSIGHAFKTSDVGCRPDDGEFLPKHVARKFVSTLYFGVFLVYEFDPPIQFTPSRLM